MVDPVRRDGVSASDPPVRQDEQSGRYQTHGYYIVECPPRPRGKFSPFRSYGSSGKYLRKFPTFAFCLDAAEGSKQNNLLKLGEVFKLAFGGTRYARCTSV